MSRNKLALTLPTLAIGAVLAACGGGGGGGGKAIGAASISTPEEAVMVALPAIQTAEAGSGLAARGSSGAVRSSARQSRFLPQSRPPAVAKRGGGQGGTRAANFTEPCTDGGTTTYYDPQTRDVNSPFTGETFVVYRTVDNDCTEIEYYQGGQTTYFSDGSYEDGCPVSDPDCYYVSYSRIGTADSRARSDYHDVDSVYGEFEASSTARGVFHTEYDEVQSSYDERFYVVFDTEQTYTDNGEGGTGAVESFTLSGYLGSSSSLFQVLDTPQGYRVNGTFGFRSPHFPECELGSATIHTVSPMYVDSQTFYTVGELEITSGSNSATVVMHADGTVDVTIDGNTQTLSAVDFQLLREVCPYLGT